MITPNYMDPFSNCLFRNTIYISAFSLVTNSSFLIQLPFIFFFFHLIKYLHYYDTIPFAFSVLEVSSVLGRWGHSWQTQFRLFDEQDEDSKNTLSSSEKRDLRCICLFKHGRKKMSWSSVLWLNNKMFISFFKPNTMNSKSTPRWNQMSSEWLSHETNHKTSLYLTIDFSQVTRL